MVVIDIIRNMARGQWREGTSRKPHNGKELLATMRVHKKTYHLFITEQAGDQMMVKRLLAFGSICAPS